MSEEFVARIVHGIADFPAETWDRCAGAGNPFVAHAFLGALEASGSATEETGWAPHHVMVEDESGTVQGVMPMYLKPHSYGEYVFDWGWADAFERAGGRYYPKLQVSVPFTPATGPRLLAAPDADGAREALAHAAIAAAEQNAISSVHWTFLPQAEQALLARLGALTRQDRQYHWFNRGYRDFDDFLDALRSSKRKQIRKERARALQGGVEVVALTGADIREEHWEAFFAGYLETGARKWGRPYLTRAFFSLVGEAMADRILLVMCRRAGRWIGGALNFIGADALYGRNWGAVEDHEFLHFEACYYQAIEAAIARGLARVEAGAQGEHKIARGYEPVLTRSAHVITHTGLRDAVARYLARERPAVAAEAEMLARLTPYRRGGDPRA
ncbi:GNAT family N-acetyltransferase [Futiania mangrovi]|uniref:GNAT family N-acetyltransferase n=1 Tax=Futiania mangrovi TaxID=2959716 RepID=A0A9J6PF52_9PROT|nr:GNAT family N-acetyltransferase [Futiania mangrovii]MCP1335247.1 GNAT family N-acetyltransferase [Futiania mangrovii]